jgi:hypothetical protein
MVVLLGIVEARALVASCLPLGFLSLWCHAAVEAVGRSRRLVLGRGVRLRNLYLHQMRRWLWVGVGLMVRLFERRLLPLYLLAKDVNNILELCKSCSFSVNVLSSSFDTVS